MRLLLAAISIPMILALALPWAWALGFAIIAAVVAVVAAIERLTRPRLWQPRAAADSDEATPG